MNSMNKMPGLEDLKKPIRLETTRVWRTGQGGRELERLLGEPNPTDAHFPENWIMSTVQARNIGREDLADEGLSYLWGHEITLKQLMDTYPDEILGSQHAARIGSVPGVLTKIVDTSERTTIQVHPDKETALRLFHSPFGKTESWHVLAVRPDAPQPPCVYLGFHPDVTREKWQKIFDEQDIPAMLGCLHRFEVKVGDTFIIEAGVPHAVSENFMFLEMQEPTDFTIRTERHTVSGMPVSDQLCHQGLGFDVMFDCFHYDGPNDDTASKQFKVERKLLTQTPKYTRWEVVGYGRTNCFKLHRFEIQSECEITSEGVCSALFVMSGAGVLECSGSCQELKPGAQYVIPACCNDSVLRVQGDEPLLVFRSYGPHLKDYG